MTNPTPRHFAKGFYLLAWLSLFGLLFLAFQRQFATQAPEVYQHNGVTQVVLRQSRDGHYRTLGELNQETVPFLLDTGASSISIPASIADRLGLPRGASVRLHTANGIATGYRTELESLRIGGFELQQLPAIINSANQGDEILLGMGFLRHVDFFQSGDTLTLQAR